jgi:hypothetical protein
MVAVRNTLVYSTVIQSTFDCTMGVYPCLMLVELNLRTKQEFFCNENTLAYSPFEAKADLLFSGQFVLILLVVVKLKSGASARLNLIAVITL